MSGRSDLVASIASHFERAVQSGKSWSALCPAHADQHASLTISAQTKTEGAVMLVCGAGCSYETVLASANLERADLYPDRTRRGSSASVLREFDYRDEMGLLLYRVRRLDTDRGARNKFVYVHPTSDGWAKGAGTDQRVLFNLPELLSNPDTPIMVTEGERDAESLAKMPFVTTTVASGRWSGVDLSIFRNRGVMVMVDNDRAGFDKGTTTCNLLHDAGAGSIDVYRPPDAYKDATAALTAGEGWSEFLRNVSLHVDNPPVETWEPGPEPRPDPFPPQTETGTPIWATMPTTALVDTALSDLSVRIYGLLDIKSGPSGLARITHAELAKAIGRSQSNLTPIRKALAELIEQRWIEDEGRRGWYLIRNPARTTRSPFSPQDPKHPSEVTRSCHFGNTNVPVQRNGKSHGHATSADVAVRQAGMREGAA